MSATHYETIAKAIAYIQDNFKQQPDLDEVAAHVHLSPHHFQRIFTEWAGVSPKKFLQYTSIRYAKELLAEKQVTLFDAAEATGLSGTGRLHDLFVHIEAMTPGDYKNGGESLRIAYQYFDTPFGKVLIADTDKGICHMHFCDDPGEALNDLKIAFPKAALTEQTSILKEAAAQCLCQLHEPKLPIRLFLKGTSFQLKVWEALLHIPFGEITSYGKIAAELGSPTASRAVGTAIGDNPVAFLIPCHRVLQSGGKNGGYRWGIPRKSMILGKEAVHRFEK